jgi:predicted Zn-dependent protease
MPRLWLILCGLLGCLCWGGWQAIQPRPPKVPTVTVSPQGIRIGVKAPPTAVRVQPHSPSATLPQHRKPVPTALAGTYIAVCPTPYLLWDDSHRQGLRYYMPPNTPTVYKNAVVQALTTWQTALGGLFTFTPVNQLNLADVEIQWHTALPNRQYKGTHQDRDHVYGFNYIQFDQYHLISNDIDLRMLDEAQKPISAAFAYNVALHEIGHMLGIRAHSPNPNDIMVAVSQRRTEQAALSAQDVATLKQLYQLATPANTQLAPAHVPLVAFRAYEALLKQAHLQVQQQHYPQAQALLQQAMQQINNDPQAPVMLSDVLIKQNLLKQAKAVLAPWANTQHPMQVRVQANYVTIQALEVFAMANAQQWALARPAATQALQNLSIVVKRTDLEPVLKTFLVSLQPDLQEIAAYNPQQHTIWSYGPVKPTDNPQNTATPRKKHWWQSKPSDYTNKVPVYLPQGR